MTDTTEDKTIIITAENVGSVVFASDYPDMQYPKPAEIDSHIFRLVLQLKGVSLEDVIASCAGHCRKIWNNDHTPSVITTNSEKAETIRKTEARRAARVEWLKTAEPTQYTVPKPARSDVEAPKRVLPRALCVVNSNISQLPKADFEQLLASMTAEKTRRGL